MNIQELKGHISHRVFELAKEVCSLTDGKHQTEHHQPCPVCRDGDNRFRFYPKEKTFHCRRCGFGGDIFQLVEKVFNESFADAYNRIAQASGYDNSVPPVKKQGQRRKVAEYIYADEHGKPHHKIIRYEYPDGKKDFPQYKMGHC